MNLNTEFEVVIEGDYPEDLAEAFYDSVTRVTHMKLKSLTIRDLRVVRQGRHVKVSARARSFYTLYQMVIPAIVNIMAPSVGESVSVHIHELAPVS